MLTAANESSSVSSTICLSLSLPALASIWFQICPPHFSFPSLHAACLQLFWGYRSLRTGGGRRREEVNANTQCSSASRNLKARFGQHDQILWYCTLLRVSFSYVTSGILFHIRFSTRFRITLRFLGFCFCCCPFYCAVLLCLPLSSVHDHCYHSRLVFMIITSKHNFTIDEAAPASCQENDQPITDHRGDSLSMTCWGPSPQERWTRKVYYIGLHSQDETNVGSDASWAPWVNMCTSLSSSFV